MSDAIRKPFFVLALVLVVLTVLLEMGSALLLGPAQAVSVPGMQHQADGWGVQSIVLVDALLMLTLGLMGMQFLLSQELHGRAQGIVTLVVSLLVLLGALALVVTGLQLLGVMLALLLAPPFGTLAYLAVWGHFDRSAASLVLAMLLLMKLGCGLCLLLAHPRFLLLKGLVLLWSTSVVAGLLVAFLQGMVPSPLVSVTDLVSAIVVAVVAVLWAIHAVLLSLRSVGRALG
jgi:hypothetical protein